MNVWRRGGAVYLWSKDCKGPILFKMQTGTFEKIKDKTIQYYNSFFFAVRAASRSLSICSAATTNCPRSWKRNREKSELLLTRRPAVCSPWVSPQLSSLSCSSKATHLNVFRLHLVLLFKLTIFFSPLKRQQSKQRGSPFCTSLQCRICALCVKRSCAEDPATGGKWTNRWSGWTKRRKDVPFSLWHDKVEVSHHSSPLLCDWGRSRRWLLSKCLPSVLMWRYTNIPSVVEEAGRKDKRCSLSQLCLEGLLRIFTACQQRYPDKMAQLLSTMGWTWTLKALQTEEQQKFNILLCFCRHWRGGSRARRSYRDELLLHPTVSGTYIL